MKPAAFQYVAAGTVDDALAALARHGGDARLIAGGQTLGPMLNLRLAMPPALVDIAGVQALKRIDRRGATVAIGACATHAAIEDAARDSPIDSFLAYVASQIAYRTIRNRGTIGGSLCHADPAADWVTAMMLLDARLHIVGLGRKRDVAMASFMRGAFTTDLQPGEILASVDIPALSASAHWGYYRIARKAGDFPEAIGAVLLDPPRRLASIVAGALDGAPLRLPALAAAVAQRGRAAATPDAIKSALAAALPAMDTVELQLHSVAVRRAVLQALPND